MIRRPTPLRSDRGIAVGRVVRRSRAWIDAVYQIHWNPTMLPEGTGR